MFLFTLLALDLTTALLDDYPDALKAGRSDDYPYMLGSGYDLSVMNLWDFSSGTMPKQVLDMGDLPASCARSDDSCSHISGTDIKEFSSVSEAYSWFQSTNSFSFSASLFDVTASVKAAWGAAGASSWFSESYGSMGWSTNVKRCHTLETRCLAPNGGDIKLTPGFQNMIANAKDNHIDTKGCNPDNLDYWDNLVVRQFGTHMATQTRNGATMRYQDMMEYDGQDESKCMFDSVCMGMEYAGFKNITVQFGFCTNSTSCSGDSSRHAERDFKCRAIGGETNFTSDTLCNNETTTDTRLAFFNPSDDSLNKDTTVVGIDFMPIDELAFKYNIDYDAGLTIQKAREYHMCKALFPTGIWEWSTEKCSGSGYDAKGYCKCTRECKNGGVLDESTCTCKCPGNDKHGFKGEDCSETYGSCQPGAGTGYEDGAKKCPIANQCGGWRNTYQCKATDVCCITIYRGTCCPYGHSCDCTWDDCSCVPPSSFDEMLSVFANFPTPAVVSTPEPSIGGLPAPTPQPTMGDIPSSSSYTQKDNVSCRKQKIKVLKNGAMKTYKTFNLAKAQAKCDELGEECVGVMDSGCNGRGKYTLCKKSDKKFKNKPGTCIYLKEN